MIWRFGNESNHISGLPHCFFPVLSWGVMAVAPSAQPIQGGTPVIITWVPDYDEETFNLFYSYDKITWVRIVSGVTGSLYNGWTAPMVTKTKNLWIKVVSKDAGGTRLRAAKNSCANRIYDNMVITSPFPCNTKLGTVGQLAEATWSTDITDVSSSSLWFKPEGGTFREIAEVPGNPRSIVYTIPKPGVPACKANVALKIILKDSLGSVIAQDKGTGTIKTNWHPNINGNWTGSFYEQGLGSFSASAFMGWPFFTMYIEPNSSVSVSQTCSGNMEWTGCTSANFGGTCYLPTGYYYYCTGSRNLSIQGSLWLNMEGTSVSLTGSNQCGQTFSGSLTR